MTKGKRVAVLMCLVGVIMMMVVGTVGCGDSTTTPTETATITPTEISSQLDAFKAKVDADVELWTSPQLGTPPPGPEAVPGKHIVLIPSMAAAEGAAHPIPVAQEIAEFLGWELTIIDAAGDPVKMNDAVEKAITLKADGVITIAIDAQIIKGSLEKLKAAGIPCVSFGSENLDNLCASSEYTVEGKMEQMNLDIGYAVAEWAWKESGYDMKMIMMTDSEFISSIQIDQGVRNFVEDCQAAGGDCQILAEAPFLVNNVMTTAGGLAVQTARMNPDFNVFWAAYDFALMGMIPALEDAGLTSNSFAVSVCGNAWNTQMIREGGYQRATVALAYDSAMFSLFDDLNRIFSGQQPIGGVAHGCHAKLITTENVPASGVWNGDIDYIPYYQAIWFPQ